MKFQFSPNGYNIAGNINYREIPNHEFIPSTIPEKDIPDASTSWISHHLPYHVPPRNLRYGHVNTSHPK